MVGQSLEAGSLGKLHRTSGGPERRSLCGTVSDLNLGSRSSFLLRELPHGMFQYTRLLTPMSNSPHRLTIVECCVFIMLPQYHFGCAVDRLQRKRVAAVRKSRITH